MKCETVEWTLVIRWGLVALLGVSWLSPAIGAAKSMERSASGRALRAARVTLGSPVYAKVVLVAQTEEAPAAEPVPRPEVAAPEGIRVAPDRPAQPRRPGRAEPRGLPADFAPFGIMRGAPGGPAAIAATDRTVYVLQGNRLYAFDAKSLKELARTTLEEPGPPPQRLPELPPLPRGPGLEPLGPQSPPGILRPPDGLAVPAPVRPRFDPNFGGFSPFAPGVPGMGGFRPGPIGPSAPTIAATDQYVYVLRGNRLYSFDAKSLKEVARATLEGPAGAEPRGLRLPSVPEARPRFAPDRDERELRPGE